MKKIYESPDKGKTIYERNFGDYDHRKLVEPKVRRISLNIKVSQKMRDYLRQLIDWEKGSKKDDTRI